MSDDIRPEMIAAAIEGRRDDLVSMIQRLVQIPSLTGSEGEVQTLVAELMDGLGLEVDQWVPSASELAPYAEHVGAFETLEGRPNVVGTWRGASDGQSLILNAHIDTVEAGDLDRWASPPFEAAVIDGRIVGRGACDMKAGLATHLIAIGALKDVGFIPAGSIHVQSVISEEDGGAGALAACLRGYRADGAIITEPTDLAVVVAQGGSLVFRIMIEGKSAHACVRDEGVSAFELFLPIWTALNELESRRNRELDHPLYAEIANKVPINIGIVRAGSWPSSVPEWLVAEGRAGLVPGEDLAAFKSEFEGVVKAAVASNRWLSTHPQIVEWFSGQFAPAEISADAPLVTTIRQAHQDILDEPAPRIEAVTYGADMRHFSIFAATPCLMYGAGDVRLAHHADESIAIDDVVTAAKTIALTIARWCGSPKTLHR
jgi:acetylornithine deacetylase